MHVRIENLIKRYEDKNILDIKFTEIPKNSLCGIIGPNGAGKSTLVRIIAGLERPTSGHIYYNGQPVVDSLYKDITLVSQKPYLLRASVFNNIAYPLKIRKENKREIIKKVNELLERMGIEKLRNQNAWNLSGGEAQKVALARALIFKPSLLILDEPTANIDPSSIFIMEEMIRSFYRENDTSIVIVTHNIQQAKRLCHSMILMNKGRVEDYGKADELIHHSQNPITRKFIEGEIIF